MRIKGFISFTTDTGKKIEGYNAITQLGDAYFKAKALREVASMRGIEEGMDFIDNQMVNYYNTYPTYNINRGLCVYLLNLTEQEKATLQYTNTLPIYKPNTFDIDDSKVVGWASLDRTSTQAKQGTFNARAATTVLDDMTTSLSWQWEKGKTVGTFNCIVLGTACIGSGKNRYHGTSVWRGLEVNDVIASETVSQGYMLPPGIAGITSTDEILLGNASEPQKARIKLNLSTKIKTELTSEDAAYDFKLISSEYQSVVVGTKFFYIYNRYVWVYDTTAKTHTNTNIYTDRASVKTMFVMDNHLYVPMNSTVLYAYELSTYTNVSSKNINISALLGIPLNTEFFNGNDPSNSSYCNFDKIGIHNYGSNYAIRYVVNSGDYTTCNCVIVSNLKAPSTIDVVPHMMNSSVYTINGQLTWFRKNVVDELYRYIKGFSADYNVFGTYGVKKCLAVGNMLSYKVLETPQTIEATEIAQVEYSYKYQ